MKDKIELERVKNILNWSLSSPAEDKPADLNSLEEVEEWR